MPWTKQQQKVIDQRDADILVSAAAGSGKTAVLVERIIPVPPSFQNLPQQILERRRYW